MRVDVTGVSGAVATGIQVHESFRTCVGQSCAEFVKHLLQQHQSQQHRADASNAATGATAAVPAGTQHVASDSAAAENVAMGGDPLRTNISTTALPDGSAHGSAQSRRKESSWRPGVYLPEQLASNAAERSMLLQRLTSTPGTTSFQTVRSDAAAEQQHDAEV